MQRVNPAFTGAQPPPTQTMGSLLTTCFHLQLAYFQQPILGPGLHSLLSSMYIVLEKNKGKKEERRKGGDSKVARPKNKEDWGSTLFKNKENSGKF